MTVSYHRMIGLTRVKIFVIFWGLILSTSQILAQPSELNPAESTVPRIDRAILIGISKYPNLSISSLDGTATDILEWQAFLKERFHLAPERIYILSEEEGANNADLLPTRSNIEQALRKLADETNSGDSVFVFISGHGTQLPENPDEPTTERDGLDSAYLPRDTIGWGQSAKSGVQNAIRDHEMGAWLRNIQNKNAFIWFIADTCHSGDGLRNRLDAEDTPRLVTSRDLKIPDEIIQESQKRAKEYWNTHGPVERQSNPANVAFYACLPFEQTYERMLPLEGEHRRKRGIFSYTIRKTLTEALTAERQITYRELLDGVRSEYRNSILRCPTPLAEGDALDYDMTTNLPREVKPVLRLTCPKILHAGSIQGVTPGTILEVFDPNDSQKRIIGHVRVTTVSLFESETEPCEYEGMPICESWPSGVCNGNILFTDYGDLRLNMAIMPNDDQEKLVTFIKNAENLEMDAPPLFRIVDNQENADFLLENTLKGIQIVPCYISGGSQTTTVFGPFSPEEHGTKQFRLMLDKMARARNLLHIAENATQQNDLPGEDESGEKAANNMLDVQFLRVPDGFLPDDMDQHVENQSAFMSTRDVLLKDGDYVLCKIQNNDQSKPLWITVLIIDSEYNIECSDDGELEVLPLKSGESRYFQFQVRKNEGLLPDRFLVIGTKMPSDFRFLSQTIASLPTKGEQPVGVQALLTSAVFGSGKTRGMNQKEGQDTVIRLATLHVSDE